jgi:hypothetical protein
MTNRKALRAYVALLKCEVGNLEDRPGGESQRLARERRREKMKRSRGVSTRSTADPGSVAIRAALFATRRSS